MAERENVQAGPVRLAYRVCGPVGASPVLLLHALGESAASWDEVAAELAGRFRVYAPDLRGHGDSDWPGEYSTALMLEDVLAFLDALGLGRVDVVGHSMGGIVTYKLAGDHPDRVDRVVLEDVAPPFPRDDPMPERPDVELPFDWPVVPSIRAEFGDRDPAWETRLERITARTLVVAGGEPSHIPQHLVAAAAERIPDSRLMTIDAGHMVHDVKPKEYTEAVLAFLADGRNGARPA